jgi:hypothetical protein
MLSDHYRHLSSSNRMRRLLAILLICLLPFQAWAQALPQCRHAAPCEPMAQAAYAPCHDTHPAHAAAADCADCGYCHLSAAFSLPVVLPLHVLPPLQVVPDYARSIWHERSPELPFRPPRV